MRDRYRIALIVGVLFGGGAFGIGTFNARSDAPPDACLARLITIDNPRFEEIGRQMRFDGSLLFRPRSLYVEGLLEFEGQRYRMNRTLDWRTRWLSPGHRDVRAIHTFLGDTLPTDIASHVPLIGEASLDLQFVKLDAWLYAVFSNDVFVTYCKRMPTIDVLAHEFDTAPAEPTAQRP